MLDSDTGEILKKEKKFEAKKETRQGSIGKLERNGEVSADGADLEELDLLSCFSLCPAFNCPPSPISHPVLHHVTYSKRRYRFGQ